MESETLKRLVEALGNEGWAIVGFKLTGPMAGEFELTIIPHGNAAAIPQASPRKNCPQ